MERSAYIRTVYVYMDMRDINPLHLPILITARSSEQPLARGAIRGDKHRPYAGLDGIVPGTRGSGSLGGLSNHSAKTLPLFGGRPKRHAFIHSVPVRSQFSISFLLQCLHFFKKYQRIADIYSKSSLCYCDVATQL